MGRGESVQGEMLFMQGTPTLSTLHSPSPAGVEGALGDEV